VHHTLDDPSGKKNPLVQEIVWQDDLSATTFTDTGANGGSHLGGFNYPAHN